MKKYLKIGAFILSSIVYSQVGINTENPQATLDITAVNANGTSTEVDGILVPRVDRQRAQNMASVGTSTLIYVYDISTGTASRQAVNIDTVGFYYFDGSVWQKFGFNIYKDNGTLTDNRIVTMGDKTFSFNSTATTGTSHFSVDGSTLSVDAVNNRVGIGTTTPNAKLDIRTDPTSTSDPREGFFGLGTTTITAPTAGAGALRYNTASGGILQYSNGVDWNTLETTVKRSIVVAEKTSAQSVPSSSTVNIVDWITVTDANNDFDSTTGIFTAPRTGNYTVSFNFDFSSAAITARSQIEATLRKESSSGINNFDKKGVVAFPVGGTSQAGAAISFTIKLNAGDTVRPAIWHDTGNTKQLRVGTGSNDGFVNFSVVEL
ncbi:MAG: hypothetical protein LBQ84_08895 [Flavobacteriaceae bacterium]|jgi:hypothetical protein|nr:hypothetical protein [Flavobacteriaceae bacterium]